MDFIHQWLQALWELPFVMVPLTYSNFPAVIDLKDFRLCRQGIKSFWNFSNYDIAMAHPEVLVENVHLTDSLMTLSYLTNAKTDKELG